MMAIRLVDGEMEARVAVKDRIRIISFGYVMTNDSVVRYSTGNQAESDTKYCRNLFGNGSLCHAD